MKIFIQTLLLIGLFPLSFAEKINDVATFNIWNQTTSSNGDFHVLVKVKNKNGLIMAQNMAKEVRVTLDDNSGIMGLTVTSEQEEALRMNSNIEYIDIDHTVYQLNEEREDGKTNVRKLLEQIPWGIKKVFQDDLSFFENLGSPSQPFKVCVADTGYDLGHVDLPSEPDVTGKYASNYGVNWDFDPQGHGTHCSGTVAAIGNNGIGVTSVIPNNKGGKFQLVITKALGSNGSGSSSAVLAAVSDCISMGAKVVSLSLGCNNCWTRTEESFYKSKFEDEGILFIAAAGNSGNSQKAYPSSYRGLVSIGSITSSNSRSSFSQYNDQVELTAPGSQIKSTTPGNNYRSWSGTSMATPHVAAVAGLVWSYFPNCKSYQIRNVLDRTAKDLGSQGCDIYYGYGLVQAKDAYNLLSAGNCGGNLGSSTAVGGCSQISNNPTTPNPLPSPTNPPTKVPTKMPTPNPTLNPIDCRSVLVKIFTDEYPEETSFKIENLNGIEFMSGSNYVEKLTEYTASNCLPRDNNFRLTIYDNFGDGMCCTHGQGRYYLYVNDILIKDGGTFTISESITFSTNESTNAPTPSPTNAPVPSPITNAPVPSPITNAPVPSPITNAPVPSPITNAPVPSPSNPVDCVTVLVKITTDNYPEETNFRILNPFGALFLTGGSFTEKLTEYILTDCLPLGTFIFLITDSYGDGMCCNYGAGSYELTVNGAVVKSGGEFAFDETTLFSTIVPSNSPIVNPTPNPTTIAPAQGPVGCLSVKVTINTDFYPTETSFKIMTLNGNILMSGNGYTGSLTEYTSSSCLPTDTFTTFMFVIVDSYGDGMCCIYGPGGYKLEVNGATIKTGGNFENSETTTFAANGILVTPSTAPISASCVTVTITIKTDDNPEETFFYVVDQNGNKLITGGLYAGKRTEYKETNCLSHGDYEFTMKDNYGDGLCCIYGDGRYELDVDGVVIKSGGSFLHKESTFFSINL